MEKHSNEDSHLKTQNIESTDKIIVLVGASGSGKSTLGKKLTDELNVPKLITTTTRPIRREENHGVDYYFVGKNKFNQMIMDNLFLETNIYSGYKYGLTVSEINKYQDSVSYIIADINGAREIANQYPDRVMIFWIKTKPTTLIKRMKIRKEKPMAILKRLYNGFKSREFISPSKDFSDISFTEISAENSIVNNFDIIYYKLLMSEYRNNSVYLKILESKTRDEKGNY